MGREIIKEWPRHERPREKLLKRGASVLTDAELLAVVIGSGTRGNSALDIARHLLADSGSLRAIVGADRAHLCRNAGLGAARYARLQAALEIMRRTLTESMREHDVLADAEDTRNYLTLKMRDYGHEVFACLFLDGAHRLIAFEELFHGTIDGASVYPREVVKRALYHNAAAAVFAHNHPSGRSEPSLTDRLITRTLKQSLELIGVRVLDHFVVGEAVTSFVDRNLL